MPQHQTKLSPRRRYVPAIIHSVRHPPGRTGGQTGLLVRNRQTYIRDYLFGFNSCSRRISPARACKCGTSQRNTIVAATPPRNWANTNEGTSIGRIPANVSLRHLAMVTAGFANEVDTVNQ